MSEATAQSVTPNVDYIRRLCDTYSEARLRTCEDSPERRFILDTAIKGLELLSTDVLVALLPVFGRHSDSTVPDVPLELALRSVDPSESA